jgi:hypothetical protein
VLGEQKRVRSVDDLVPELARRFITFEEGSRLPTVRALAERAGTSPSSIHQAIARLEKAGAIRVERRGRLGSFLASHALGALWALGVGGPLVIALPLAGSRRYEALATAIKAQFTGAGLEVFLIFVRGSRQRLRALQEGRCHLAVMSAFAVSELCGHGECSVLELPPDTFNTGHRVFYSATPPRDRPIRALVDRDSVDQQGITTLEFLGTDTEFLPARNDQFPLLLEGGQGDAAVWTLDEMQVRWPPGILDRALSERVVARIGDTDRRAALVARSADSDVLLAIARAIDPDEFQRIQAEVLARRMVPEY